jgi:plastocyanin
MAKIWMAAVLAGSLLLAGCGGDKPAETAGTEASSPAASGPPAVPDEANGGMITGKVAFTGEKPRMPVLDMSANPACERAHKGVEPESEEVIVNRNGTLKNVFVWVKSGLPAGQRWAVPATAVTVDQNGCMYRPRVAGVMTGQSLQITNSDPTNHNIHPQPRVNPEWNESQSPQQAAVTKTFGRQEVMIPVKCNVHPWMRAFIGVVAHPFFAVTGDDGTFTIRGLPPGTYVIQTLHEKYGPMEQTVTVGPKESKTVEFSYKG